MPFTHLSTRPLHVTNALTIDIEDYYQAFEMRKIELDSEQKDYKDSGTQRVLHILAEKNVKATFFINGSFAEGNRDLVRQINDQGHEIGIHSYTHRKVNELSPSEFSEELRKSKEIIEGIIDCEVLGYRAPAFSFDEKDPAYSRVLVAHGLTYDSSTNPIPKILHGHPEYESSFHEVKIGEGSFMEFPLATFPVMGKQLPWAGGFYLRILPYTIFRKGLRYINKTHGSAVIYVHNWEFDPRQPKIDCSPYLRFIHYYGLSSMEGKFRRLLNDFRFAPLKEFL